MATTRTAVTQDSRAGEPAFLFTDVVGSTRLWEEQPEAMACRMESHDQVVLAAVETHGGEVFSTAGDSFAAVFPTAADAVDAALAAQRGLEGVLAVRMAVHAGPAERRDGDWFGPTLNRCGRLRDAAHGGQILVTSAVYEVVDPSSVSLVDLGRHRLRDLSEPERVFQIAAAGLPSEFPPIRSLGAFVHNLPVERTPFFGRTEESNLVDKLLADTRHATLVGPGGSGKTRLALQVAADIIHHYPDGVWLVDYRTIDHPSQVAGQIAATLRIAVAGERPLEDQVVEALWARQVLLVLDNCDHVLEGVSPLVERLLRREGTVRVLATSREPLGLVGESIVQVGPLPLPSEPDAAQLVDFEAIQLFCDRAQTADPGFDFDRHTDAVFDICRAVDGLPLALELAAARLKVISAEQIAARLDDQLAVLKTSQKAGDLRHATIEATIAWSWNQLAEAEQTLFARLSVFVGTWTLDTAETVCGYQPLEALEVLDLVSGLVDKSLVATMSDPDGPTRYRLLEPLRQYAAQQLDHQQTQQLRHRVIDHWSRRFGEWVETLPEGGNDWQELVVRARPYEPDLPALMATIEWALARDRHQDAMTIFAGPVAAIFRRGGHFETACRWVDTALEHRDTIDTHVLEAALLAINPLSTITYSDPRSLKYMRFGAEIARSRRSQELFTLYAGSALSRAGELDRGFMILDQVFAETDDPGLKASCLFQKANEGFGTQANWDLCRQAMELSSLDSLKGTPHSYAIWTVGFHARNAGHYDLGADMLERSLGLVEIGDAWRLLLVTQLAVLYTARGDLDHAASMVDDAIATARPSFGPGSQPWAIEGCLRVLARIARLQGDHDRAQQIIGSSSSRVLGLLLVQEEALIARDRGDLEGARGILSGAEASMAESEPHASADRLLLFPAHAGVALRDRRPAEALEMLAQVLPTSEWIYHCDAVDLVDLIAIALAQLGQAEPAAHLFGAADRQRDDTGLVVHACDQPLRDEAVARAQTELADHWWDAYQQGREMTLDDAFEYAQDAVDAATAAATHG